MDHFLKSLLSLLDYYLFCSVFFCHKAHGILAPPPETESTLPELEGGLNHWTAREVPILSFNDISWISFRVTVYQYMQQTHSCLQHNILFSSVTQSCLTLWDPMDCSTPGFPVHHQLPELTQTHVHWVGDAIQPSYPLSSSFPPA